MEVLLDMQEDVGLEALRGGSVDASKLRSRMVRVFFSSASSDMKHERNAFWEKAYPDLQVHCQSLGLFFEVVDFRWGVCDAVPADHVTAEISVKEIQSCQKDSVEPLFIALLGNHYGHRPIPRHIPEKEFELLVSKLSKDSENLKLLNQWFLKDNNSVPPMYTLQPITAFYSHYSERSDNGPLRDNDVELWNLTEARILQALRTTAQQAERDGDIHAELKHSFFKSVLECEIEHGFFKIQNASAVIFLREQPRASKKYCKRNFAKFFLDAMAHSSEDAEDRQLLSDLKQRISKTDLQPLSLEISKAVNDPSNKDYKEYLGKFCEHVTAKMKELINRHSVLTPTWSWLKQEIFHHAALSEEKCSVFRGRDGILGKICLTVWESSGERHEPILVHGPSGVGKSALLCQLARELRGVLDQPAVVVLRLLGTSPLSSDADSIIKGICFQVCGALGLQLPSSQATNDLEELIRFFHSMLEKVSEKGDTLLLILDAIEQLKPNRDLYWIPKVIPPNVIIVISTSDDFFENCKCLVTTQQNIFRVDLLTEDQGKEIIDGYMSAAGRRLTPEQLHTILNSFNQSGRPLHLKVMLDAARGWRSYSSMSGVHLGPSAQEVMTQFLESLEKKHGRKLVSHTLGFILLSRHGLSEAELQNVLSLDNDVLAEIYKNRLPPSYTFLRFPPFYWSRVRLDLGDYLAERWEDGVILLNFSHRQFAGVIKERYFLSDLKTYIHTVLAEYFYGQWSQGRLRPILLPSLTALLSTDRKVPTQPLYFAKDVVNLRKLHELPYHLAHAGKWEELRQSVFGSFDWLCCKSQWCGLRSVIQDLLLCTSLKDCTEMQLLRETFLLLQPSFHFSNGHFEPSRLATELYARLQGFSDVYLSVIGPLCCQCVEWFESCTDPVLVPKWSFFQPPGGPLKTTLTGLTKGVKTLVLCSRRKLLVAGSEDGLIMVWSLRNLQTLYSLQGHSAGVLYMNLMSTSDHFLSTGLDGTVRKWSLIDGQQLFVISDAVSVQTHNASRVYVDEELKIVLTNPSGTVKAWHLDTAEALYEVTAGVCSVLGILGQTVAYTISEGLCFSYLSTGVKTSQTSSLLTCSEDEPTCSLTLTKIARIVAAFGKSQLKLIWSDGAQTSLDLPSPALFLSASEDEKLVLAGCDRNLCVFLVTLTSIHKVLDLHHDASVLCAVSSPEGSEIITSARDRLIRVWSVTTGALLDWTCVMDSAVSSLAVHNRIIISTSLISNTIKLWHLDYNKMHKSKNSIPAFCPQVVLSKDAETVYYVKEGNKTEVFTWSRSEGLCSKSIDVSSEVCCMELAQQKHLLFCGLQTGTILIYPLEHAPETLCLPPPESLSAVGSMAISPQEHRMAVAYEDAVCLFEITTRDSFPCVEGPFEKFSLCFLHSPISAMTLLPDCRLIYGTFSGEVVVYDFKSSAAVELDRHGAAITCITASHWDSKALVCSQDSLQKLWSLNPVLLNHTVEYKGFSFECVTCAVFSTNDKYIFTGSMDKTIRVWDVGSGSLLYVQYVYSSVLKMMAHKDGVVAVSENGSFIKQGFRCPDTLKPEYCAVENVRVLYRVSSPEKNLNAVHTVINKLPEYNPAGLDLLNVLKTKQSNTCDIQ